MIGLFEMVFMRVRGGTCIMGYSMRTDRYRYTEWIQRGGEIQARELYDHEKDPKENVNLAVQEDYADMIRKLGAMLHEGWRASRPPGVDRSLTRNSAVCLTWGEPPR